MYKLKESIIFISFLLFSLFVSSFSADADPICRRCNLLDAGKNVFLLSDGNFYSILVLGIDTRNNSLHWRSLDGSGREGWDRAVDYYSLESRTEFGAQLPSYSQSELADRAAVSTACSASMSETNGNFLGELLKLQIRKSCCESESGQHWRDITDRYCRQ